MRLQIKKILVVIGTRPEAIKLAPVIIELRSNPSFEVKVFSTGQHKELLDGVLEVFGVCFDHFASSMMKGQDLFSLSFRLMVCLSEVLSEFRPDLVLVHGDTSTAFIGAYCSFLNNVPIAHVEAGLRTSSLFLPFPEEGNRRLISVLASLHFAPTKSALENLERVGIDRSNIFVTGNTVVDALLFVKRHLDSGELETNLDSVLGIGVSSLIVTVTLHRRENLGENIAGICDALERLAIELPHVTFVWPVHKNPKVSDYVFGRFGTNSSFVLIEPLAYVDFIDLLRRSYLVITDSGGIQEEAPSLNIPVVILRDETERPEVVEAGAAVLVGASPIRIYETVLDLFSDKIYYSQMSSVENPFGSGAASKMIASIIDLYFEG